MNCCRVQYISREVEAFLGIYSLGMQALKGGHEKTRY